MTPATKAPRAWLTIQEASDLLGVSPATLRRWTESGDLEAFVTPGGHRRFARTSILDLLPTTPKRRRRLHELGETPERVVRQYRRELAEARPTAGWVADLNDADREAFREPGRRILTGVLGFLDARSGDESEASLADALDASARYGAMSRRHGIELDALTETFLRFRLPFLDELGRIARRRRLPAEEGMDLLLAASRAFDRLLLALIQGHGGGAGLVPSPAPSPVPVAVGPDDPAQVAPPATGSRARRLAGGGATVG